MDDGHRKGCVLVALSVVTFFLLIFLITACKAAKVVSLLFYASIEIYKISRDDTSDCGNSSGSVALQ